MILDQLAAEAPAPAAGSKGEVITTDGQLNEVERSKVLLEPAMQALHAPIHRILITSHGLIMPEAPPHPQNRSQPTGCGKNWR